MCGEDIKVLNWRLLEQDEHLNKNQQGAIRCGDNGIFKGMPITREQKHLTAIAKQTYDNYPFDGKYIIDGGDIVICQSNIKDVIFHDEDSHITTNPLGY